MISIVICSKEKKALERLASNIASTVGLPYEIIVIENPNGHFGICQAYNDGVAKAHFDILCFMHEDIYIETPDWGKIVVEHLAVKTTGLLGLAGGDTKSLVPGSWPSYISENEISLVQHYKDKRRAPEKIIQTGSPTPFKPVRVACIDGVWMCTRKDVFSKYQFDDQYFKRFHGYDIDFSLQVNQSYHVYVVFDILLHHYSEGSFNREWLAENIRLSNKWRNTLPFSVKPIGRQALLRQHWTCMHIFIDQMADMNCTTGYILINFVKFSCNRFFHLRHFMHGCKKIVRKKLFRFPDRKKDNGVHTGATRSAAKNTI